MTGTDKKKSGGREQERKKICNASLKLPEFAVPVYQAIKDSGPV
jgi:hypothetical protein